MDQAAATCIAGGKFPPFTSYHLIVAGCFLTKLPAYMYHGQICYGTERIILVKSIAEDFIAHLKEKAASFNVGLPVTVAMAKGAKFLLGGPQYGEKNALVLTIVTGVTKVMLMWNEETFGPSVAVFIVNSDEEAIDLVSDTLYGFSTSVHTTNLTRALNISKELDIGQVQVNANTVHGEGTSSVFFGMLRLMTNFHSKLAMW